MQKPLIHILTEENTVQGKMLIGDVERIFKAPEGAPESDDSELQEMIGELRDLVSTWVHVALRVTREGDITFFALDGEKNVGDRVQIPN